DLLQGTILLAELAANPFQRWVAQRELSRCLHRRENPLLDLYRLLSLPALNVYVFAPVEKKQWQNIPSHRQLLIGELGGQRVDTQLSEDDLGSELLTWWLTKRLRIDTEKPLNRFAALLYALLKQERSPPAEILNQPWTQQAREQIENLPGGPEISHSFAAFTVFLNYKLLGDLPRAADNLKELPVPADAIRPAVIAALLKLSETGEEIQVYQDASSRANKFAAITRAIDSLEKLKKYVDKKVNEPERYVLLAIIDLWQPMISSAGGELGRKKLSEPVVNPYVAGNPVTGSLFAGREDILRRFEELWASGGGQCPSIVLFGHRRMGKTSILQNLGARFGRKTHLVDFNMQRVGFVENTGELLYNLALACFDSFSPPDAGFSNEKTENEPRESDFMERNPYTAFDRYLKDLDKQRQGLRLLVLVDEFELIEKGIVDGRLEKHLLEFWRGMIQTYQWFIMVFAGLHTLDEMCHDYWNPLFGSVTAVRVSFLTPKAARRLIVQPDPDFSLDYDAEAIEEIIAQTNGQPYLLQLICHNLVSRFNRQTFEEGVERQRRFSLADVRAVIEDKTFFRDGNAYFTGVWGQADEKQRLILKAIAQNEAGLSEAAPNDLAVLEGHDVLKQQDGAWVFTVELMRRWVRIAVNARD
ncbi:MAG: ATP-binding protein, partial [Gammaproteobacteria bacterium]|nr:ATP-binding protein [Gammaproteobacteria bacterium]